MIRQMFKLSKYLWQKEKVCVLEARLNGYVLLRPTAVLFLLISVLYVCSPVDILPEALLSPLVAYLDDLALLAVSLTYLTIDIMHCRSTECNESKTEAPELEESEENNEGV